MGEEEEEEEQVIPVGYRFYPTEDELVSFYLKELLQGNRDNPLVQKIERIIPVLNIYEHNPWDLPKKSGETCRGDPQQEEWFFFIPGQDKEVRGGKPNRLTSTGYWKATGSRGCVYSNSRNRVIGSKMTMVFYKGRAPGEKTQWKMNEYRAVDDRYSGTNNPISNNSNSSADGNPKTRVEFSICRVYVTSKCLRAFDRRPPLSSSLRATVNRTPAISLVDHPNDDEDDQVAVLTNERGQDSVSRQDRHPSMAMDDGSPMEVEDRPGKVTCDEERPAKATCDEKADEGHRQDEDDEIMNDFINMATIHDAPLWECEHHMYDDFLLSLMEGHELF